MDKAAASLYFPAMLRLLTIIATVFALALASFTTFAHETGMAASVDLHSGMRGMEHVSPSGAACPDDRNCMSQSGLCKLACMGVGVFLPPARDGSALLAGRETYPRRPGPILVATPPVLDHRPPIAHVL